MLAGDLLLERLRAAEQHATIEVRVNHGGQTASTSSSFALHAARSFPSRSFFGLGMLLKCCDLRQA